MTVQASWHNQTWEISPERLASIGSLSATGAVKRVSDSTTGKSKITGMELMRISLSYVTTFETGGNPRQELETWQSLLGVYDTLRIGGRRFGPKYLQLLSAENSDSLIDNLGRIRRTTINLVFIEYPTQESSGDMQIIYKGKNIYPNISPLHYKREYGILRIGLKDFTILMRF